MRWTLTLDFLARNRLMNFTRRDKLDRKVERAERFMWGSALVWGISVVLLMAVAAFAGSLDRKHPPRWVVLPFLLMIVPAIAAVRWAILRNKQKKNIRFGIPHFAFFTDRKLRVRDDQQASIGLSSTLVFVCLLCIAFASPGWILGMRSVVILEVNAVMMLICTTPFVAIGASGLALLWRSHFDKQQGTLTIWNWLKRYEFPLSQVDSVDVEYEEASQGVTTGVIDEKSELLSSSGDRAGHGPLWRVYVALRDQDDSFRIHIATIESRKRSAQCMAIAIAKVCDCPIRSMHGPEQECDEQRKAKHNRRKRQHDKEN